MILLLDRTSIDNIISNASRARNIFKALISQYSESLIDDPKIFNAFSYSYLLFAQSILTLSNCLIVKRKLGAPRSFLEGLQLLIEEEIINIDNAEETAKFIVETRDSILHGTLETTVNKIKEIVETFPLLEQFFDIITKEITRA